MSIIHNLLLSGTRRRSTARATLTALAIGLSTSATTVHAQQLLASDGTANATFTVARGLSFKGNTAVIGAPYTSANTTETGRAYVFKNLNTSTGVVNESFQLTAADLVVGDQFGSTLSFDGSTAVVGAIRQDVGGVVDAGAAYVYQNVNQASGNMTPSAKLLPLISVAGDAFGGGYLRSDTALIWAQSTNATLGKAYVYRNVGTATGTVTENAQLTTNDTLAFGFGTGRHNGDTALVGARWATVNGVTDAGAAYLYRNLATINGTVTESAKLTSSVATAGAQFGVQTDTDGTIGLVGAFIDRVGNLTTGSAYVYRNLDTATGTVTENARLIASDGAQNDRLGYATSLSGTTALVGASSARINGIAAAGAAYLYFGMNTVTGNATENLKFWASDAAASGSSAGFGFAGELDGDRFVVGAWNADVGANANQGKAYVGTVSSMTTLDAGNANRTVEFLSFKSADDWVIGQNTDNNVVTFGLGTTTNTANVTTTGKAVYIGQNAGSDNNRLELKLGTSVTANSVNVGATGNTGNVMLIEAGATVTGNVFVSDGSGIAGSGSIVGNLEMDADSRIVLSLAGPLSVTGSVLIGAGFGIDNIDNLSSATLNGVYTVIGTTTTDFSQLNLANWGAANAFDLGGGKSAYFEQGSLRVMVVPEPSVVGLVALGATALLLRFRRPRA